MGRTRLEERDWQNETGQVGTGRTRQAEMNIENRAGEVKRDR